MNSPSPLKSDPSTSGGPNDEGIFQAELSDFARRPPRSPLVRGVWLLLFTVGVAVAMILYLLPSERAKWRIAAAQAKWLDGDLAGAIQILDAAAVEFPETPAIYEQRIQFCIESKEFEKALADAERLAALSPNSPSVLGLQSQIFHHLGRHDEAITVCREILRLAQEEWIGNAPSALNGLAYAQAIGDTDLEEASKHIDEALRLAGDNAAMLDTRAFVKYRLHDSKAAREDIEPAVEQWEKIVTNLELHRRPGVRSYQSETERAAYRQALAVMLYHRSLIYEQLGMQDEAKVDRERVHDLGFEPNEQLF